MKRDLSRRDVLKIAAAGSLGGLTGCAPQEVKPVAPVPKPSKMPVVFVSHGSPMAALHNDDYTKALRKMGESIPTPKAVAIVSAHWVGETPVKVTASEQPPLIYDFYGFPKPLYDVKYPAPGQPKLAAEIASMLTREGIATELDPERGLDHGAWVPMRKIFPGADIPTLQVNLCWDLLPAQLLDLGAKLAPLRERGVLIIGSGGWTHNLSGLDGDAEQEAVKRFDAWAREKLERFDLAGLADYRTQAPGVDAAHPTTEHWDVIYAALGACTKGERIRDIVEGTRGGAFSLRTFTVG